MGIKEKGVMRKKKGAVINNLAIVRKKHHLIGAAAQKYVLIHTLLGDVRDQHGKKKKICTS